MTFIYCKKKIKICAHELGQFQKGIFRKTAMKTLLAFAGHMTWYVWMEETGGIFKYYKNCLFFF